MLHLGKLRALPANIRLGWKGLSKTNAQAYFENSFIADKKSFITLAQVLKYLPYTNPSS